LPTPPALRRATVMVTVMATATVAVTDAALERTGRRLLAANHLPESRYSTIRSGRFAHPLLLLPHAAPQ
jgi:hypothetical protein